MKLSIAIASALVAGAAANAVPEAAPEPNLDLSNWDPSNFHGMDRVRYGHTMAQRDANPEADPKADPPSRRGMMGRMPGMPCPERERMMRGRMGRERDSWMPGPLSALLSRLGLDIGAPHRSPHKDWSVVVPAKPAKPWHHGGHHHEHGPDHGDGHHKDHKHHHGGDKHHKDHDIRPGHPDYKWEGDNVDYSIFIPIAKPEMKDDKTFGILPIFGDEAVQAKEAHREALKKIKQENDDDDDDDEDDDDDHHHKHGKHHKHHKDHKKHKHGKHHKHKHGKHHKHKHATKIGKFGHRVCNKFASLPPHVRATLSALMTGTVFLTFFGATFLLFRRRRLAREDRKARRRQRKEARRAAKAAYKAAKANSKQAEAGFEYDEEALPSYKDNETDALVERQ